MPVLEADYVVAAYGTGVVMGVPTHDERDRRFATARGLPVAPASGPVVLDPDAAARVGRPAVRYRLRDWLISRQRYWGPPIPIVHCADCGPVPVPEAELPVLLPEVADFRPTRTGASPLASTPRFAGTRCPVCGGAGRRETDVSDTFLDSAWYFLRYPSAGSADAGRRAWDPTLVRQPDFYAGGPEHVQRHHLYARFMTMALFDLGLVPFEEPFPRLRLGGLLTSAGAKMSKSRGNVVSPDPYADRHGADVLRCALLFSCPWESGGEFHDEAIAGIERFFAGLWRAVSTAAPSPAAGSGDLAMPGTERAGGHPSHESRAVDRAVRAVTSAMARRKCNVALARLMEASDTLTSVPSLRVLVLLLAPLAPHLAEELWERLCGDFSVHRAPWPTAVGGTQDAEHTVVVQVDGRVRGHVRVAADASEEEVLAAAVASTDVRPRRVVAVPGRLVNLVTDHGRGPIARQPRYRRGPCDGGRGDGDRAEPPTPS